MAIKSLPDKVVRLPTHNRSAGAATAADRIEYMADMLLQLKELASAGKFHVLSGILEVAYQEACAEARRS